MLDMGLSNLKSYAANRYMPESSLLKKMCRSELTFKDENLDNGGNELNPG